MKADRDQLAFEFRVLNDVKRSYHEESPCSVVEKDCCSYDEHCHAHQLIKLSVNDQRTVGTRLEVYTDHDERSVEVYWLPKMSFSPKH